MPLFTKSLKLKSFSNKRFGRYLLYALGELILVVAGILIALNINNINEQHKSDATYRAILNNVVADLKSDTLNLNNAIENFRARKRILAPILKGTFTPEQFKTCLLCGPTISSFYPISLNDKGYLLLKNFYENTQETDSLPTKIVQFYIKYDETVDELENEMKVTTVNTVKHWRDNYPWFANTRSNIRDDRFVEYLQSEDYRNRVAYFDLIVDNLLLYLHQYKMEATEILIEIDAHLNKKP